MNKEKEINLATPLPEEEIKKFDLIAKQAGRSRAAELRLLARKHIEGGKPVRI